eukprot:7696228-Pyramimonas_sp.AAC.2
MLRSAPAQRRRGPATVPPCTARRAECQGLPGRASACAIPHLSKSVGAKPAHFASGLGPWPRGKHYPGEGPNHMHVSMTLCGCRFRWGTLWGHERRATKRSPGRAGRMRAVALVPLVELPVEPRSAVLGARDACGR